jgi:inorganic pyrophosphatase
MSRATETTASETTPNQPGDELWTTLRLLFKPHPWHGVDIGAQAPAVVTTYVEITPADSVKYEIDKPSGHLKIDRPQQFSNVCPTLYGFVPQTYCGTRVAALSQERTGRSTVRGDGDPLDICVLSEKSFSHGDFLLQAVPVGGLRLLDRDEADDKIVAVLQGDAAFGHVREIADLPVALVDRLQHYFLTYKRPPVLAGGGAGAAPLAIDITHVYDRAEACEVIERSREDYRELFPALRERVLSALRA